MRPCAKIFQSILRPDAANNSLPMSQTTIEFSSSTENLAIVRAFVRRFLEAEGVSEQESTILVLGVDEACSNIIRHAYGHVSAQPITLSCECEGRTLRFCLRDFGDPVDPEQFSRRALEEIAPGGLGLHLIERIFDEAVYHPRQIGTELVLVKRLT